MRAASVWLQAPWITGLPARRLTYMVPVQQLANGNPQDIENQAPAGGSKRCAPPPSDPAQGVVSKPMSVGSRLHLLSGSAVGHLVEFKCQGVWVGAEVSAYYQDSGKHRLNWEHEGRPQTMELHLAGINDSELREPTKDCRVCKKTCNLGQFHRDKQYKDGRNTMCSTCKNAKNATTTAKKRQRTTG